LPAWEGTIGHRLAENALGEKRQIAAHPAAFRIGEQVSPIVLRKIEQSHLEECQYSEYLTLLTSFLDVMKSV
jgi:hypothetical protein